MTEDEVCSVGSRFKCGGFQRGDWENGLEVALKRQEGRCPSPRPRGERKRRGQSSGFQVRMQTKGESREEAVNVVGPAHN